jgi:hypothetical protein
MAVCSFHKRLLAELKEPLSKYLETLLVLLTAIFRTQKSQRLLAFLKLKLF